MTTFGEHGVSFHAGYLPEPCVICGDPTNHRAVETQGDSEVEKLTPVCPADFTQWKSDRIHEQVKIGINDVGKIEDVL